MNIQYRQLTKQDLNTFVDMRISQLKEEGAKEEINIKPNLLDYYHRHLSDGTFISWIAIDDEK